MANQEHVTIKTYPDAADAVAAEILLYENGFSTDDVKRSSTRIRVKASRANEARALLESATPGNNVTADDATGAVSSAAGAVTGAAASTADAVTGAAASTAGAVSSATASTIDTVQNVASSAVDTVQDAASSAVDTAQDVASAVVDKVQDATSAVTRSVGQVADVTASKVEGLADKVYEAGVTPGAPSVQATAARTAASTLDRTAEYLREGDLSLILEDLRGAIRRNPGSSLLLGLGLGYLARGSLFGGSGSTAKSGSQPSQSWQSQAVPVYAGGTGAGYDAAMGMPAMPVADTMFGADLPGTTLRDTGDTFAGDTTLYGGSGLSGAASLGAIDTLPETMLYGTDAPMTSDMSGMDDTSLGTDYGQSSSTSYADSDLGGMSGLGTGTGTGGLSDLSTGSDFGDAGGDFGSASDVDLGASSAGTSDMRLGQDLTDTDSPSSTSLDEQLRQWDSKTRREES